MLNCGAVEVVEQPPHTVVVQENCNPPQVVEIGIAGPQGPVAAQSFEAINKNLKSLPAVAAYGEDGKLASLTYDGGRVVKAFTYTNGKLTQVTLSGPGVPAGIPTAKVFTYTAGGKLEGYTYE